MEKKQAIVSYDQELDFTLEPESSTSDTGRSSGCGKALGSINKSGTYSISSSGGNRNYIINIPTDYDKDKPYRLIFGMHCMGGSAEKVAGTTDQSKNFYGTKTQADKDNIQCIYVAPQGDAGGTWNGSRDIPFFFDLQKYLKDNLCIDTNRVFSVGFSFGAMYTYALSLKYPNILRAVACNAPANYNFDQPPRTEDPIAYIQTTGTNDGTCPWEQGGGRGGKYCLLQHAEDNGCNTDITIKLANSGTHVVTEFEDCNEGYPVRFMSHNGGHECNKTDQGSNVDWIPVEFWNFFKRF
jgi:poly(3-hydroxybutyrate) depolymerase